MLYPLLGVPGFDLVEYPDSDKVACSVGAWPSAKRLVFRRMDQADYFGARAEGRRPDVGPWSAGPPTRT